MRKRDRAIVAHVATDLSATGMQVLTRERVLTGELVRVVICLPRTERWLTVDAHVARVVHGRRPGEWGRRLGLQLEGLSVSDAAKLRDATSSADLAVPGD
jgi:hypothetical protein